MSVRWSAALSSIRRLPASADVKTLLDAATGQRGEFFEFLASQKSGSDLLRVLDVRSALLRDAKRADKDDPRRRLHSALGLGVRDQFSEKNVFVRRILFRDLVRKLRACDAIDAHRRKPAPAARRRKGGDEHCKARQFYRFGRRCCETFRWRRSLLLWPV